LTTRHELLRQLWAMLQTRAEAGVLVLQLQRDALTRGLAWYAVAAVVSLSFVIALVLLVAFGTPAEYRLGALALLCVLLLLAAGGCVLAARRRIARDAGLIAAFTDGLRLDLALLNQALQDPAKVDRQERLDREQAGPGSAEAATGGATRPDRPADNVKPEPTQPPEAATETSRAPAPEVTEIEASTASLVPPEAKVPVVDQARPQHGNP
jgi:uncharacterized membrane protein YqjE